MKMKFDRSLAVRMGVLAAAGAFSFVLGCGSDDDGPGQQTCFTDAECGDGRICLLGVCEVGERPGSQPSSDPSTGGGQVTSTEDPDATTPTTDPDVSEPEVTDPDVSEPPSTELVNPDSCVLPSDCVVPGTTCVQGECVEEGPSGPGTTDTEVDLFENVWMVYERTGPFASQFGNVAQRNRIQVMRTDGTGARLLATGYTNEAQPVISPDARTLAFVGANSQENPAGNPPEFALPGQIVFWDLQTNAQIGEPVHITVDGTEDGERINGARAGRWEASFSLDGSRVFFIGTVDNVSRLFAVSSSSREISELAENVLNVRVGPRTGRVFFTVGTTLHSMEPDGSDRREVIQIPNMNGGQFDVTPDERSAIFVFSTDGGSTRSIRRIGFAEGNTVTLTSANNPQQPRMLPDGERFAVLRFFDGGASGLRFHSLDGGAEVLDVTGGLPGGHSGARPSFSRIDASESPLENAN
ncbi:MAG: hypothetical protein EA398_02695 [Deltaproteobacteria bacterium]|nr:MAG: hypothetical protein EA398_02695 [Deltaproteobacteria bacterium]